MVLMIDDSNDDYDDEKEEQKANLSPKTYDITQNPSSPHLFRCKLTTTIIGVPPWAKVLSCPMKSFS